MTIFIIIIAVAVVLFFIFKASNKSKANNVLENSFEKSRAMENVIRLEKRMCNDEELSAARHKLYLFLLNYSDMFNGALSELTFEQFCSAIDEMKARGFLYSSKGDYLPIATFCFFQPLGMAVGYFSNNERTEEDWNLFSQLATAYFDNN